ncbi:tripartite tricarboxylate transporter substrate binding protein [Leisingera sp. ANG59]|uniref:Bug family tripartite tricarboxylate transporter substrate binding protein n=1 Tax=Leisingera sp. ANG59 TaxID=2675221 RepID=UPI001571A11E|nr:tripartite tricarboxylate transporter substrate-binding protein [Leisingera sp. ANG59]NSY39348.1 tripartite tricarboxylate transporter substrate binding protein [Leisingera sp. ANG59]
MKKTLFACVTMLLLMIAGGAIAQTYPDSPVRIFHGFSAGGNADTVSRIIAEPLTEALGQPFVVEPKPGAGGNVASSYLSKQEPDGKNLIILTGGHAVSGAMMSALDFDPVEDFTFVSRLSFFPFFIAVQPGKFASLDELIKAGKADRLTFGSAGFGTTQHLTGELLAQTTGANIKHIPYKGDAGSVAALMSGEVDMVVAVGTSLFSQAESGQVELLAVSSAERWPSAPEVPTVAETVAPGFDVFSWIALAGPAGLSDDVLSTLNGAVVAALDDPAIADKLAALGGQAAASTPDEMAQIVATQIANWNSAIDAAGIERK